MAVGEPRICQCGGVIGWQRPQQELVATGPQEAIADPNPDKSTCVKTGRDNRTPENLCAVLSSEGEVEAVARAIAKQADARCFDVMASGKEILHYREDCDYFRGLARAAITAFRSVSSGKVVRWEDISSAIARMAEKRDVAVEECKDLATSPAGKMIYWLESGAASATHLFAGRLSEELETAGSDQSGRPGGFVAGPSGLSQDSSGKGEG